MPIRKCERGIGVVSNENSSLLERIDLLEDVVIQLTGALVSVRLAVNMIAIQPGVLTRMDAQREVQKELAESVEKVDNILNLLNEMLRKRASNER